MSGNSFKETTPKTRRAWGSSAFFHFPMGRSSWFWETRITWTLNWVPVRFRMFISSLKMNKSINKAVYFLHCLLIICIQNSQQLLRSHKTVIHFPALLQDRWWNSGCLLLLYYNWFALKVVYFMEQIISVSFSFFFFFKDLQIISEIFRNTTNNICCCSCG